MIALQWVPFACRLSCCEFSVDRWTSNLVSLWTILYLNSFLVLTCLVCLGHDSCLTWCNSGQHLPADVSYCTSTAKCTSHCTPTARPTAPPTAHPNAPPIAHPNARFRSGKKILPPIVHLRLVQSESYCHLVTMQKVNILIYWIESQFAIMPVVN